MPPSSPTTHSQQHVHLGIETKQRLCLLRLTQRLAENVILQLLVTDWHSAVHTATITYTADARPSALQGRLPIRLTGHEYTV